MTTEFFGLLCPGMPERALRMGDLPIRTVSRGYATHAAQFDQPLWRRHRTRQTRVNRPVQLRRLRPAFAGWLRS